MMATPNEWRQRSFMPAFFIMSNAVAHSVRPFDDIQPQYHHRMCDGCNA